MAECRNDSVYGARGTYHSGFMMNEDGLALDGVGKKRSRESEQETRLRDRRLWISTPVGERCWRMIVEYRFEGAI